MEAQGADPAFYGRSSARTRPLACSSLMPGAGNVCPGREPLCRTCICTDCDLIGFRKKVNVTFWQTGRSCLANASCALFHKYMLLIQEKFLSRYKYSSEKIFSFFCFFIHFSILSAIKTTRFLAKGRIRFPLFAGKKKGQRQAMYSLCCPKRPFPGQGTECPKNLYENVTARCPRMHCLRSGPTPACRYASQGRKAHACRRRG